MILIIDFGSQYTMLIARRIRELGVHCEIVPCTTPDDEIESRGAAGVILSGGPSSVYDADAPPCPDIWDLGVPILGICYGMQIIVDHMGGTVASGTSREYGRSTIATGDCKLFDKSWGSFNVWMSHGDECTKLPPPFLVVARSEAGKVAAIANTADDVYGLQFHPEVVHSEHGTDIISRFVLDVCRCLNNWNMSSYAELANAAIAETVGSGRVLCALSGGVDSSVVAALLNKAIPGQVYNVFVDTGLSRLGEVDEIRKCFTETFPMQLEIVDARYLFMLELSGVTDPERKRKIIGETFIRVFEETIKKTGIEFDFLAQGTLYPDVIESTSYKGPSHVIKSHHNVGGLPDHMRLKLVEPLRELFKDEVRELGLTLGLPPSLIHRQPFPGPGMAIRVLGEVTNERVKIARLADAIVREMVESHPWDVKPWQYFAVLLPTKSVGVMGDKRTYESTAVIRIVTSEDGMTASCADVPTSLLRDIASRIVNEVRGINRVVYDVTTKPPATIEWE